MVALGTGPNFGKVFSVSAVGERKAKERNGAHEKGIALEFFERIEHQRPAICGNSAIPQCGNGKKFFRCGGEGNGGVIDWGIFAVFFAGEILRNLPYLKNFAGFGKSKKARRAAVFFARRLARKSALRAISEKFGIFLQPPNAEG